MRRAKIYPDNNKSNNANNKVIVANICEDFLPRLKGYMFAKEISQNEALFFLNGTESKMDAAIHMFFMNFDLAVFWLDKDYKIVDKTLAKKWHPLYYPSFSAKAIIETHPDQIDLFNVGDQLIIEIL